MEQNPVLPSTYLSLEQDLARLEVLTGLQPRVASASLVSRLYAARSLHGDYHSSEHLSRKRSQPDDPAPTAGRCRQDSENALKCCLILMASRLYAMCTLHGDYHSSKHLSRKRSQPDDPAPTAGRSGLSRSCACA